MDSDDNDVDAAFEELIGREFGEVVTAPGRPPPHDRPTRRAPAPIPLEPAPDPDEIDEPLPVGSPSPTNPVTKVGLILVAICIVTVLLSMGGINIPGTALILAMTSGGAGAILLIWQAITRRERDDAGPWGNHSRL
ncbi:hypothetical protein [Cutibacterium avidum]|uniref:hypothetical protein n=1 Tax=Cutibacterium avidum TaxID=33010 RepID=UPI001C33D6F2|nr:hypothetical protein [Cutibacterium avidum]BCQ02294.1 hypothetical protein TPCV4_07380 [Cutibacterium avidum]